MIHQKIVSYIVLLLIPSSVFSQTWELYEVNKHDKYPYDYRFRIENKDDSCSHKLHYFKGSAPSVISVADNLGVHAMASFIVFRNTQTQVEESYMTDMKGLVEVWPIDGNYDVEIHSFNFDFFQINMDVRADEYFTLDIQLGLGPELYPRHLYSKEKISDEEIERLIKCVEKNPSNPNPVCGENKKYRFSMEI